MLDFELLEAGGQQELVLGHPGARGPVVRAQSLLRAAQHLSTLVLVVPLLGQTTSPSLRITVRERP